MRTIITSAISPQGSEELAEPRQSGPVVFAYDRSSAAEHALGAAARMLAERRALVLVVWTGTVKHVRQNRAALDLHLREIDMIKLDEAFPPPIGPRPLDVL